VGSGVFASVTAVRGQESTGADLGLILAATQAFADCEKFKGDYYSLLPGEAVRALDELAENNKKLQELKRSGIVLLAAQIGLLAAARIQLDYVLTDSDIPRRRLVERAFLHLRRSLVVDDSLQARWMRAFEDTTKSETLCEKLGSVHLLAHG